MLSLGTVALPRHVSPAANGLKAKGRKAKKALSLHEYLDNMWVLVKIMVPFWVPSILGAVFSKDPKRDQYFDNHHYRE